MVHVDKTVLASGTDSNSNSDSDASDAIGASDTSDTSDTNDNTGNTDDVWVSDGLRSPTCKRLLREIRNTMLEPNTGITNKAIWLEDTATMRHIRLALEDNCSSCIRHPNLTIDGGSHSFTPAMQTNFDECCL